MDKIVITPESWDAAMSAVVTERGESYTYSRKQDPESDPYMYTVSCVYVEYDGTPGCLFGTMLVHLGVSKDVISRFEGQGIDSLLRQLERDGVIAFPSTDVREDITRPSIVAQSEQDRYMAWGDVLDIYRNEYDYVQRHGYSSYDED